MVKIESHMHGENGDGRGRGMEGSSSTTTPPLFGPSPPPPASVCVDCYPTLAAHSMLPATSRADHSSRRRAPRCEETHALPLFFSALSYAVAARLDSPGSALFESCEAFHAPSHPLPLRRNHDFARPLRRVPTPNPDLEPWWLSRPPIPVGPQQARSSQLAARSQQLPLARRQPADPSDSSDEATR